jgi:tetratricopeptide (TPR) repeat protein
MSFITNTGQWMKQRVWLMGFVLLGTSVVSVSVWSFVDARARTDQFTVALAYLEHDASGEFRNAIADAIRAFPNTRLVRIDRITPATAPARDAAERAGHEEAYRRLITHRADAVIWGSVLRHGNETRLALRWTPSPDLAVIGDFNRYAAIDEVSFPPLLWDDIDPVLRLLMATYVVDLKGLDEQAAADAFFPFLVRAYDTLAEPSEGAWNAATGARVEQVIANALVRVAEQINQPQLLEDAVDSHRDVLATYARWREPLDWARAESNLGGALAALGERSSDMAKLEGAVNAFRAALWEQTPERAPLQRAQTQIKLGNALTALGTRQTRDVSAPRLEEAVTAYRAALTDETRARMPLAWAVAQNNLGSVLTALGDLHADTARTEEAVTAYRAALSVDTRRRIPLQWATVQGNLASALTRLGEARSDAANLKEAVTAYRAALSERPRDDMPLVWAATQNNLGNALRILGQIQSDTTRLEQAADAYAAALAEFTRAKSEPQIDTAKRNLERTLKTITDRKQS